MALHKYDSAVCAFAGVLGSAMKEGGLVWNAGHTSCGGTESAYLQAVARTG